jgi:hypothetical protein
VRTTATSAGSYVLEEVRLAINLLLIISNEAGF